MRKEYEGSLERILPLKDRLARTDALIDQVVYRLYGLTEEEIGVGRERDYDTAWYSSSQFHVVA